MKRFRIAGLGLLAVLAAASPALGAPAESTGNLQPLTVSPEQLAAGETVTVSGAGCAAGNRVQLDLYNPERMEPAIVPANGAGSFQQIVKIPASSKVGRAWIRATCMGPDSEPQVMQATLLVSRPEFVITGTNIVFGVGTSLFVIGLGMLVLRQPEQPSAGARYKRRGFDVSKRRSRRSGKGHAPAE